MSVEIDQFKLHALFANPTEFYDLMRNRRGYTPKQQVEFDAELVAPGWTSMGCVLFAVMVHHEKKAYVIMLPSDDCTSLREALEQQQVALNYRNVLARPRGLFGL
jgi:hypothetical protein